MNPLVTTEWLAAELGKTDIRVIDATMFLSGHGRNARAEFEAAHIPGAVFFDIDEVSDTTSSLPHMLPPPEKFASRMQALGLGDGSRIIVYDNSPLKSAARVWWMLTLFGAHEVCDPRWRLCQMAGRRPRHRKRQADRAPSPLHRLGRQEPGA